MTKTASSQLGIQVFFFRFPACAVPSHLCTVADGTSKRLDSASGRARVVQRRRRVGAAPHLASLVSSILTFNTGIQTNTRKASRDSTSTLGYTECRLTLRNSTIAAGLHEPEGRIEPRPGFWELNSGTVFLAETQIWRSGASRPEEARSVDNERCSLTGLERHDTCTPACANWLVRQTASVLGVLQTDENCSLPLWAGGCQ
jgi:hypothetical protein